MTTQTTPLEVRLTDPHAFRVATKGGTPVFEVDTLTLAAALSGRFSAERFVAYRDGDAVEFSPTIRVLETTSDILFEGIVEGELQPFVRLRDWRLEFGPGGIVAPDVSWERENLGRWLSNAPVIIRHDGVVWMLQDAGNNLIFLFDTTQKIFDIVRAAADPGILIRGFISGTIPAMQIQTDRLEFGPGGASALDVSLIRGAANRLDLASGDAFVVTGGVGDFGAPVNGMFWYNTTTGKMRVYESGAWQNVV